jgi:outer membrane protein assembly factor BamB
MRFMALAVLAVCLALTAVAADWPCYRGPFAEGTSPETGINKDWAQRSPKELWRVPMNDRGFAGPSVAAGKVFIIDHQGDKDIVRALDLTTGTTRWTFEYQDANSHNYGFSQSTPAYDNGQLYVLSCSGQVHCLNAETGAKLWNCHLVKDYGARTPTWRFAMSPLIDGEKVILCPGATDGAVIALDKTTGKLIWKGG